MFDLQKLVRENIKNLVPYSSARGIIKDNQATLLDANENAFSSSEIEGLNRYPDPLQVALKKKFGKLKGVGNQNILLGNGSDEIIEIILKTFCDPGKDNIVITPPTYGMYEVSANIHDVEVKRVNLNKNFQLIPQEIIQTIDRHTKLMFLCSPNNPTGNILDPNDIEKILREFNGMVVLDEAYIDFSDTNSWTKRLGEFPNLIILQTLSKAWGLASLRLGIAMARGKIIDFFNKVKAPYNIGGLTQQTVLRTLENPQKMHLALNEIKRERSRLMKRLGQLEVVEHIFPSEANFLLIRVPDPKMLYQYLMEKRIIVRDRSTQVHCKGCLRVTVGTPEENDQFIGAIQAYKI
ncbi:MAG: histidinol-phosphate transaminase [Bacteroidetes bacterium]|nr:histidinol-phosphate transaminase [Bacteroidota bacterium]